MVQGQHQVMLLLASLDHAGAQQRPGFQVERRVRLDIGQLLQTLLALQLIQCAEVLPAHAHSGLRRDLLTGHTVNAWESGAQGFMTHDQGLQGCLETPHIQYPAQARHAADVIGRAVRFHLPEEPHALLGIGQGDRLAAVDFGDGSLLVALARRLDQPDLLGKIAQLAGFEQGAQRQLDVTGLAGARDDLRGQQRVPAQCEKVIAQANAWQAQHLAPDRGDLQLQDCVRFDVFAGLPYRLWQGAPVELATGAQGMASRRISSAGTMYSGNSAARAVLTVCSSSSVSAV